MDIVQLKDKCKSLRDEIKKKFAKTSQNFDKTRIFLKFNADGNDIAHTRVPCNLLTLPFNLISLNCGFIKDMGDDEIKGILAHEFGHILQYQNRKIKPHILQDIHSQFSDSKKTRIEKGADADAIDHGFRQELLKARRYTLDNCTNKKEKKRIQKYYMSPQEIRTYEYNANDGFIR